MKFGLQRKHGSLNSKPVFDAVAEVSNEAQKQDAMMAAFEPPSTPEVRDVKARKGPLFFLKEVYLNFKHMGGNHTMNSPMDVNGTTTAFLLKKNYRAMQRLIRAHKAESVAEMLLARMVFFLRQRAPQQLTQRAELQLSSSPLA